MWLAVMIVSFLGYMCHYYHFLFAFFLSAFYMFYLLVQRNWKKMIWYASSMGASLLLTALLFPSAYHNLFGNGYSQRAVNGFSIGEVIRKVQQFLQLSTTDLFAGSSVLLWLVLGIMAVLLILLVVRLIRDKKYRDEEKMNAWLFFVCFGTTACYFVLAAYVAPYLFNRYVSAVYPLVYFLIIWLVYAAWGKEKMTREKATILTGVLLSVMAVCSQANCVEFVYGQGKANIPAVERYMDTDVYFITYQYYKVTEKVLELEKAERVRVLIPETQPIQDMIAEHNPDKEYLLVYVDSGEGVAETILNTIIECSEYTQYKPVEDYEWLYGGSACLM